MMIDPIAGEPATGSILWQFAAGGSAEIVPDLRILAATFSQTDIVTDGLVAGPPASVR